jgi:hypothetical protein
LKVGFKEFEAIRSGVKKVGRRRGEIKRKK